MSPNNDFRPSLPLWLLELKMNGLPLGLSKCSFQLLECGMCPGDQGRGLHMEGHRNLQRGAGSLGSPCTTHLSASAWSFLCSLLGESHARGGCPHMRGLLIAVFIPEDLRSRTGREEAEPFPLHIKLGICLEKQRLPWCSFSGSIYYVKPVAVTPRLTARGLKRHLSCMGQADTFLPGDLLTQGCSVPSACCCPLRGVCGCSLRLGRRAWLGLTLLVLVHRTSMSIASSVPRPFMAFCSCRASYSLGRSSSAKAVFLKCPLSSRSSTSCRSCRETSEARALNGRGGEGRGSALPPHGRGSTRNLPWALEG